MKRRIIIKKGMGSEFKIELRGNGTMKILGITNSIIQVETIVHCNTEYYTKLGYQVMIENRTNVFMNV